MNNVLVLGGFTESKALLEPVAEAATQLQLGTDAEVLTFRQAMKKDEERLRKLVAGANIIAHSSGVVALPDATTRATDSEIPSHLAIVAGPEPRLKRQLVGSASKKTFDHLFGHTKYRRKFHRRVVAGNTAELLAHPFANLAQVPKISRYSTFNAMLEGRIASTGHLGNFAMEDDVFYPNKPKAEEVTIVDQAQRMQPGYTINELSGKHDELLLDPKSVLMGIRSCFIARDSTIPY